MPWRRFSAPIVATEPSELVRITERLLAGRHDVVTRTALLGSGVTVGELNHALRSGRLHSVHAGVYARGRRELSSAGKTWAALASCGPLAALGGRAAGVLYGMLERDPIDRLALTAVSGARPRGVDVRRVVELPPATILDGLPVLMPHDVLIELAAVCTPPELARALAEAEVNRLVDHARLLEECAARRRVRPLVELLADGPRNTRSPVEDLVLPLLSGAGLPVPETNVRLHGWSVDFLWRAARVVLEVDSWTYHATASHYERDAVKQEELEAAGYLVVRRTRGQLRRAPTKLVARIAEALQSRTPPSSPRAIAAHKHHRR